MFRSADESWFGSLLGEKSLTCQQPQDRLLVRLGLLSNTHPRLQFRVKRLVCDADLSRYSNVVLKNTRSCTYTSPHVHMAYCLIRFKNRFIIHIINRIF